MKESWIFKLVPWFIGFVFLVIVFWWVCVGVLLTKGVDEIQAHGARGLAEKLWCGEEKDCSLPTGKKP